MDIAWSIRICRQPAAIGVRERATPTLRSHGNADPSRSAASPAWGTPGSPRSARLAVRPTPSAARRSADPHGRGRSGRLERPGCLVAHPPRRLDHRPPSGPRRGAVRVHGVRQSAGGARMAVRDDLRGARRCGRARCGDRADGSRCLERHDRHRAARPVARRRAGGSRHRGRARGSCRRTCARHPSPGLHVRVCLLDAADRRIVPAGWRAAALVAAAAVPPLGEPARRVHRGNRLPGDRRRGRGGQASLVDRRGRSPAAHHRPRQRRRCLGARSMRQPVRAETLPVRRHHGGGGASEGHHRVAVSELRRPGDVGAACAAGHLCRAHDHGPRSPVTARQLRASRRRAGGGRCRDSRSRRFATRRSASR